MGEIVSLMDGLYKYTLPKVPQDKDIWYYDLKKSDQFWKTPAAGPKFKWLNERGEIRNIKQMNEKEKVTYIDYWRDKWENGLWIMINGEPTYLTGMHIDHLVFNKFNKPFYYLDAQRLRFYFRELTNNDILCDGRCWVKGRRTGITAEEITEGVRCLISDFSNNVWMQSDTEKKAKASLLTPLIDTYTKRPKWMRENFYSSNGKIPRASLELIETTVSEDGNYPLGGKAEAFPSTPKAMDGLECMLAIMDELSKWEDVSPRETYEINVKTIVNPGKRGKLDALSTTGDSKEAQKAVKDWHQLIADSNPEVLNENGKTNSGLWYYFVSYIYSYELIEKMEGEGKSIKDKYGNINKEKAEEYIWNEVNKHPKDSKEYTYALYKMPMALPHALLTPTGDGYFSKARIMSRLQDLRKLPIDRKPYVIGALEDHPDGKGKVYFESNEERRARCEKYKIDYKPGKWLFALQPYFSQEKNIDTRNRFRVSSHGVFFPPINPEGGIGYDPVRYKKEDTSSKSLSDACIVAYKKFDYFGSGEFNQYQALWLGREDDPREINKECMKCARFLGYPVMHERVIESVKEDFENANMLPFLQKDPKTGLYGMWLDSQYKTIKNGVGMMQAKFNAPMDTPDYKDMYATHPFEPTLVDMDMIDIFNTTRFNAFMAMLQLEYSLKQIVYTNLTDRTVHSMDAIMEQIIPKRN